MKLEKLDQLQIESIVSKAIQDAVDFIDDEIEPQRIKAQRYYDAEVDIGHEQGRTRSRGRKRGRTGNVIYNV